MWTRFTEHAKKVVFHAQEEAQKHDTAFVSPEHLLLGLLRERGCTAVKVLEKLNCSLTQICVEVEQEIEPGDPKQSRDMTLTPQAKRVIDLAWEESKNLRNNYIGSEHLLLGLIRQTDGLANRVLARQGVGYEQVRVAVRESQGSNGDFYSEVMPVQRSPRAGMGFWKGLWARLSGRREPAIKPAWTVDPVYTGRVDKSGPEWLRYSERSRKVILHAEEEAQKRGEGYLATEHLLLGLLRKPECIAVEVLESLGLSPDDIRKKVEAQLPRLPGDQPIEINLSPRAERALNLAYEEARSLDSKNLIGTGHLLLGLIREGDGLAGRTLGKFGVELDRARLAVKELQGDQEKL